MKSRLFTSFLVAATMALLFSIAARAADETTTSIKFTDPSKPGTVKINLGRGELRIQGANTNEVTVKSAAKAITSKPRKDGLRVISASTSFSLNEKDNIVTLDATHDFGRGNAEFQLTVPRNTSIIVQNAWGGDFTCTNIDGDIELNSMHGEIRLDDVAGGIVVGTMNGEIRANIRQLHEGKPLSFTSMNGEVQIRLPENAKANVRFRTQNGTVLTDFEENVLVTKTEAATGVSRSRSSYVSKGTGGKVISVEIEESIREASRVSATAIRQALEAVKEGLASSRIEEDDARREVEEAKREIERARREMDRERNVAVSRSIRPSDKPATPAVPASPAKPSSAGSAAPAAAPKPPATPMIPKIASIPTISGGKLVTGTLNGGGPEISVSTMNGDVILRKLEKK